MPITTPTVKTFALKTFLCVFPLLLLSTNSWGSVLRFQSAQMKLELEEVLSGQKIIWGMDFLSEDQLIFTQRSGEVKLFNLKTKKLTPIQGVPKIASVGQGGLLDIHLHPKFQQNAWVYFTASVHVGKQYTTRLWRAKLQKNRLIKWQTLLTTEALSKNTRHFGSRIVFDGKGYVYFTVGDRGERKEAQNLSNHKGALLRLYEDGRLPPDNPFARYKSSAAKAIWSYGHRNPQGLAWDSRKQILWLGEHGPRGGDEVNLIQKGGNYGWPKASYGSEYFFPKRVGKEKIPGTIQPLKYYTPSIAPCGMALYTGNIYPQWKGNLFMGALKLTHLNRLVLTSKKDKWKVLREEQLLKSLGERIRHVKQSPAGWLYLSTDSGKIFRIRKAPPL